jgi:hypothetical protein
MTISASDIKSVISTVTKKWTKQRKAEERGRRSRHSRLYVYSDRVNFTEVADAILPGAYDHASGGGRYTVSKRQLYYACREQFRVETDRGLEFNYFSGTLLIQYLNRTPETASWRITADPRGTLTIPNAHHEVRVPCGTLQVEEHLRKAGREVEAMNFDAELPIEWPSLQHGVRYQAVLYIEKEGFEPLLQEARIAERFDLTILSCKGQSVVAARQFVDQVCRIDGSVPLFVVHDFDKYGFEISQCLTRVSSAARMNDRVTYEFRNKINVTDLGLRLVDVERYGLEAEPWEFKGRFPADSNTTPDERDFLRSGRRVELTAFTSPQFIEWLENKLVAHGLGNRLIPADNVLESAFRRALAVAKINSKMDDVKNEATRFAELAKVPKTLRRQLKKLMKDSTEAWDEVLYRLAAESLENSANESTKHN